MKKITSIYIATEQSIEINKLKSRCINHHFKCTNNSIVSFINTFKDHKELTFIFERACNYESILLYSQMFLNTILSTYPDLINVHDFRLKLGGHPISTAYHYSSKLSSVFSHSIILRSNNNHLSVAHLNEAPKEFAIRIANMFCNQVKVIQNKVNET